MRAAPNAKTMTAPRMSAKSSATASGKWPWNMRKVTSTLCWFCRTKTRITTSATRPTTTAVHAPLSRVLDVQVLVHGEILTTVVCADSIKGGQAGKLCARDRRCLRLERPDDCSGLTHRCQLVATLQEGCGGRIGRRQPDGVRAQPQRLAKVVPEFA